MMSEIQKPANADAQKQLGDAFVIGMFNEQQAKSQEVPKDAEIANLRAQLAAEREAREKAEDSARLLKIENVLLRERAESAERDRDQWKERSERRVQDIREISSRLVIAEQRIREAMQIDFFCNATRFKADSDGCIKTSWPELAGRWVALVPAEDDCHLRYAAPIPPADVAELHRECKWEFDAEHQRRVEVERENAELTKLLEEARKQAVPEDAIDAVTKAMRKSWQLGQVYWQQADSDSYSQNAKSDKTQQAFNVLIEETIAMLSAAPQPDAAIQAKGD